MIIFDLDGTLADCRHRRHFVDPTTSVNNILQGYDGSGNLIEESGVYRNIVDGKRFKPDWKSFYEACDKDKIIKPVVSLFIQYCHRDIEIWSGRSESVRKKTEVWVENNILDSALSNFKKIVLKMRPIGDSTPDDELKERWLNEALAQGKKIDFVVDDRAKVVRMWRRRGIFVFDVNQSGKEF